jgi:hypothetical protein
VYGVLVRFPQVYSLLAAHGYGKKDFSVVFQYLKGVGDKDKS